MTQADSSDNQSSDTHITLLFWNIRAKNLLTSIARLVNQNNVDVLILAECHLKPEEVEAGLNTNVSMPSFVHVDGQCERLEIFVRFSANFLIPVLESDKYAIRRLNLPGEKEFLIVAAHLTSLKDATEKTLYGLMEQFAAEVRRVEKERGHRRTLLIGDLNMNPFADGVVSATGLHAVSSQIIARQKTRTVLKKEYPFFYNPMWQWMVERSAIQPNSYHPPGTYYYRHSDHVCYFWNTFDQVLLRPDLLDCWQEQDVQVLTTDGETSFLSKSQLPGGSLNFDHLPVLCRLCLHC